MSLQGNSISDGNQMQIHSAMMKSPLHGSNSMFSQKYVPQVFVDVDSCVTRTMYMATHQRGTFPRTCRRKGSRTAYLGIPFYKSNISVLIQSDSTHKEIYTISSTITAYTVVMSPFSLKNPPPKRNSAARNGNEERDESSPRNPSRSLTQPRSTKRIHGMSFVSPCTIGPISLPK
jgi:hypothetical protein